MSSIHSGRRIDGDTGGGEDVGGEGVRTSARERKPRDFLKSSTLSRSSRPVSDAQNPASEALNLASKPKPSLLVPAAARKTVSQGGRVKARATLKGYLGTSMAFEGGKETPVACKTIKTTPVVPKETQQKPVSHDGVGSGLPRNNFKKLDFGSRALPKKPFTAIADVLSMDADAASRMISPYRCDGPSAAPMDGQSEKSRSESPASAPLKEKRTDSRFGEGGQVPQSDLDSLAQAAVEALTANKDQDENADALVEGAALGSFVPDSQSLSSCADEDGGCATLIVDADTGRNDGAGDVATGTLPLDCGSDAKAAGDGAGEAAEKAAEEAAEEAAEPGAADVSKPVDKEAAEADTAEMAEAGTEKVAEAGTEKVAEAGTAEMAEAGTEEVAEANTADMAEPDVVKVAEPQVKDAPRSVDDDETCASQAVPQKSDALSEAAIPPLDAAEPSKVAAEPLTGAAEPLTGAAESSMVNPGSSLDHESPILGAPKPSGAEDNVLEKASAEDKLREQGEAVRAEVKELEDSEMAALAQRVRLLKQEKEAEAEEARKRAEAAQRRADKAAANRERKRIEEEEAIAALKRSKEAAVAEARTGLKSEIADELDAAWAKDESKTAKLAVDKTKEDENAEGVVGGLESKVVTMKPARKNALGQMGSMFMKKSNTAVSSDVKSTPVESPSLAAGPAPKSLLDAAAAEPKPVPVAAAAAAAAAAAKPEAVAKPEAAAVAKPEAAAAAKPEAAAAAKPEAAAAAKPAAAPKPAAAVAAKPAAEPKPAPVAAAAAKPEAAAEPKPEAAAAAKPAVAPEPVVAPKPAAVPKPAAAAKPAAAIPDGGAEAETDVEDAETGAEDAEDSEDSDADGADAGGAEAGGADADGAEAGGAEAETDAEDSDAVKSDADDKKAVKAKKAGKVDEKKSKNPKKQMYFCKTINTSKVEVIGSVISDTTAPLNAGKSHYVFMCLNPSIVHSFFKRALYDGCGIDTPFVFDEGIFLFLLRFFLEGFGDMVVDLFGHDAGDIRKTISMDVAKPGKTSMDVHVAYESARGFKRAFKLDKSNLTPLEASKNTYRYALDLFSAKKPCIFDDDQTELDEFVNSCCCFALRFHKENKAGIEFVDKLVIAFGHKQMNMSSPIRPFCFEIDETSCPGFHDKMCKSECNKRFEPFFGSGVEMAMLDMINIDKERVNVVFETKKENKAMWDSTFCRMVTFLHDAVGKGSMKRDEITFIPLTEALFRFRVEKLQLSKDKFLKAYYEGVFVEGDEDGSLVTLAQVGAPSRSAAAPASVRGPGRAKDVGDGGDSHKQKKDAKAGASDKGKKRAPVAAPAPAAPAPAAAAAAAAGPAPAPAIGPHISAHSPSPVPASRIVTESLHDAVVETIPDADFGDSIPVWDWVFTNAVKILAGDRTYSINVRPDRLYKFRNVVGADKGLFKYAIYLREVSTGQGTWKIVYACAIDAVVCIFKICSDEDVDNLLQDNPTTQILYGCTSLIQAFRDPKKLLTNYRIYY